MFSPEFLSVMAACVALVIGGTEALKRWLGMRGWLVVVLSLVTSAIVCGAHTFKSGGDWPMGALLCFVVFLEANGLYLFRNGRRQ